MIDQDDFDGGLQPLVQSPGRSRRGVQQSDVDQAADTILLRGERPTIEKVRQLLGTGSPNTVTPLLDSWYRRLGSRLSGTPGGPLPGAIPTALLEAVARMWDTARAQAHEEAQGELAGQQQDLAKMRSELEAERARAQEEAKVLAGTRASLEEAVRLAHAQAAQLRTELQERSLVLSQEQGKVAELQAALDQARAALHDAHVSARQQLAEQATQHAQEREREAQRSAANQRHHLQELDRARQESAAAHKELQATLGKLGSIEERLEEALARERALQAHAAQRDLELAQVRTELQGCRELQASAQKMAETSALRASELVEHLNAAKKREQELIAQLNNRRARGARSGAQGGG